MSNTQMLKRGLSPTHELMGDWILANPGGTLRDMSAHFKYSPSWLSQVINSDMFRAYIGERLKEVHAHVTADIPTLLKGTAALAIERMNEVLMKTEDADVIVDAFDKVLHRHGYAPNAKGLQGGPTIGQQNNVFFLNKEDLKAAKHALVGAHAPELPAPAPAEKVVNGELVPTT
jgi:hypothetical protein